MNLQRLNEIVRNPVAISNSDVDDLRQLTKDFPYFSTPFEVLARYYFQTNHYRFEDMLRQAAMRVRDRKILYEFVHSESYVSSEIDKPETTEIPANSDVQVKAIVLNEPEAQEEKLDLEAFLGHSMEPELSSKELIVSEIEELKSPELNEATEETPFEFEGHYKLHETVSPIEEQDIIGEEIETEFSFTRSFIAQEEDAIVAPPVLLDVEDESPLIIENEDLPENASEADSIIEPEDEVEIVSEDLLELPEEIIESPIIEETKAALQPKMIDLELRKYPVYSVEAYVPPLESRADEVTDSSKDFFSWLNNPKHIERSTESKVSVEIEANITPKEKPNHSLDLIEKFISVNPQISRPKKEFFSPENMAKRSEVLDLEFVSETLAEIYYQQGNFDFAIKAYEKLSLQNPSKESFFADLIDKIKKERK